jgi:hypothetical protein
MSPGLNKNPINSAFRLGADLRYRTLFGSLTTHEPCLEKYNAAVDSVYKTGSPGLLRLSDRNNDTASCDLHVWFQVRILLQLSSHVSRYNGSVSGDKTLNILKLKNIPYSRVDVSLKISFLAQLLKSNTYRCPRSYLVPRCRIYWVLHTDVYRCLQSEMMFIATRV